MTLAADFWEQVRKRAAFACEYCGVSETETGGLLTVDHFKPQAVGGGDELENLLYSCLRCNLYKADYWPAKPNDLLLWNPRQEAIGVHLLFLADGTLHPITAVGAFSLRRLRLNRPQLVTHRLRKHVRAEELRLWERYREVVTALEQLQQHHASLLDEHRALLEDQRSLLRSFLTRNE